jgi:hypothetical protein
VVRAAVVAEVRVADFFAAGLFAAAFFAAVFFEVAFDADLLADFLAGFASVATAVADVSPAACSARNDS